MNRIRKSIALVVLLLIYSGVALCQDKKIQEANKAYKAGEYYIAPDLLKDAYDFLEDDETKNEVVFKIANCYRKTNQYKMATMWYKKAIRRGYTNPLVNLYYAQCLHATEKYDEAIEFYEKYKKQNPDDQRGERGLKSCELAAKWIENPTGYQVEPALFFNKKSNDYCPSFGREDYNVILFTSSREIATGDEIHGATGEDFSDIFISERDKKERWSVPAALGENINTEHSEGAGIMNGSYSRLYFTRCEKAENKSKGCYIYVAGKDGDDWEEPKVIELAHDTLVAAHPAITPDETVLYFTSNRPNGVGNYDIWKVEGGPGKWGKPVNLGGNINTKGNEMFPFIHPDGTLYFASDGHIGMGGLDLYRAKQDEDGKWDVENMKYPMNSPADDFGIIFEKENERGYFSSSRGLGGDDDIYSFFLPKLRFNITGVVKDKTTEKPITNANVKLVGSDGMAMNTSTNDEGKFKFMLKPATDYIFIASAKDYLKDKAKVSTKGKSQSEDFERTIMLPSTKVPIEVSNIFYDFQKWTLRPESKDALKKLVETLNENPQVRIELRAHTDFRGGDDFNMELSQKRAQSVVDYLIENGIDQARLVAKGYGESNPKTVDELINEKVPFFEVGTVLDQPYIELLQNEDYKEIAHQINRRTEFKVISQDYNKE